MITLGIELSSRQGSVALLRDGAVLAEKIWIADRVRHNGIFQTLEALLKETRLSYADVSLYAVGRGPGSFSGMRMSFAIAQALALPNKTEVRAVSSGAALALAAGREGAKRVAVIGDARRGQFWYGLFAHQEGGIRQAEEWKLVPYEELRIADGTLVVSPEAERLTKWFPDIGTPRFPLASDVAALAAEGTEALEPLYLHPPVFVQPKFG
jgi:tRNA threonylcarbamoyladenosine biosynthesis protein TsaB